jgi:hypothetical protein
MSNTKNILIVLIIISLLSIAFEPAGAIPYKSTEHIVSSCGVQLTNKAPVDTYTDLTMGNNGIGSYYMKVLIVGDLPDSVDGYKDGQVKVEVASNEPSGGSMLWGNKTVTLTPTYTNVSGICQPSYGFALAVIPLNIPADQLGSKSIRIIQFYSGNKISGVYGTDTRILTVQVPGGIGGVAPTPISTIGKIPGFESILVIVGLLFGFGLKRNLQERSK